MSHSCLIHSSIDGQLDCLHILVIVNNAAVDIRVLMLIGISVLGSFGPQHSSIHPKIVQTRLVGKWSGMLWRVMALG